MLAFHKENTVLQKNKCQRVLSTYMLECLVYLYSEAHAAYNDDIADITCYLFQYSIQHQHDENF